MCSVINEHWLCLPYRVCKTTVFGDYHKAPWRICRTVDTCVHRLISTDCAFPPESVGRSRHVFGDQWALIAHSVEFPSASVGLSKHMFRDYWTLIVPSLQIQLHSTAYRNTSDTFHNIPWHSRWYTCRHIPQACHYIPQHTDTFQDSLIRCVVQFLFSSHLYSVCFICLRMAEDAHLSWCIMSFFIDG